MVKEMRPGILVSTVVLGGLSEMSSHVTFVSFLLFFVVENFISIFTLYI